jgi:small-conductance mechanosensitive channel
VIGEKDFSQDSSESRLASIQFKRRKSVQAILTFFRNEWQELLLPAIILVATVTIGLMLKGLFVGWLRKRAKGGAAAAEVLSRSLGVPATIWILMLGLYLSSESLSLSDKLTRRLETTLLILFVISITEASARLATNLIRHYGGALSGALPVTTLTQNLARIVIFTIGILILINLLGVSITPVLTALGVGGLAVALALQDTLSNLFAGVYISLSGNIRPGHYIKLNSGEEGYVNDINWRSTTVRMLPNNLIIVPNSKLAQAIVTNYHLPEKRMSLLIPIGVSYESDPDQVESILIDETTKAVGEVPGLLAEPAPFVRFIPGFGDFSLNFTLICQVSEFVDQYVVQHELRKRILRRFRADGISIPFPTRTIQIENTQP